MKTIKEVTLPCWNNYLRLQFDPEYDQVRVLFAGEEDQMTGEKFIQITRFLEEVVDHVRSSKSID